jgi:predicted AAA+ superfamily ATPase
MSLYESQDSTGSVSMKTLFSNSLDIAGINPITIERLAALTVRGGWPASIHADSEVAEKRVMDYVDAVINQDVSRVDNVEKSPGKMRALMRSLARNIATEAGLLLK